MMSHLGRLPPLQAIGRSRCVDLEEPPELSDTEIDQFLDEYNGKERVYTFNESHPVVATEALQEHFRVLTPGGHICKRIAESATAFTHSRHSVAFSHKYAELRHLLHSRAKLQFVRDYLSRINAAAMFVKDLEQLVQQEYNMWYCISHGALDAPPATQLECLSSICDDLRVHMNHWTSVKQLMYTDPWLRPQLPALVHEIHIVQTRLYQLRNTAIWWIDRLIQVGFRVLAHCDLDHISNDVLWSITRGLEDFNSIVAAVKQTGLLSSQAKFSIEEFNSYRNIGATIKAVPFGRVLNLLASERSRYAAASTSQFFADCRGLLKIALGKKGMSQYRWGEEISVKPSGGLDTSDYQSGSHVSLGTAMLQVGTVTAPDLSQEASPLMEFSRREKTFAQKFLQIVCHSTSLLKRPIGSTQSNTTVPPKQRRSPLLANTTKRHKIQENTEIPDGIISEKPNTDDVKTADAPKPPPRPKKSRDRLTTDTVAGGSKAPGVEDKSPSRKSVSWSDASEVSIIQQLTQKYMDVLWQYFTASMMDQLIQPVWGGPEATRGRLGSILTCSDLILQLITCMMKHTCAKDIFPVGSAVALNIVSERIRVATAWRAWDLAMCKALASAAVDKCHPVMLADGEHSSTTAKSLRDAFQPLHSALHALHASLTTADDSGSTKSVSLALSLATVQRLLMSCDVSVQWCETRGQLYLSSWTLGAFLLIAQSDIKILGDEMRRAVADCQGVSQPEQVTGDHVMTTVTAPVNGQLPGHVTSEERMISQLQELQKHLECTSARHQSLSGSMIKQFSEKCHAQSLEYFDEEMPPAKLWKKRPIQDGMLEPSGYVEHALDSLLEPIIAGANKLSATSQMSVISMATTAMCEAWTDVILQRKIKFSIGGALQLEEDFRLVQTWLETYIQLDSVKQSILSLDIFRYLNAIADILKRQPHSRSSSRPPDARKKSEDKGSGSMCCEVNVDSASASSSAPLSSSSADSDQDKTFKPANQNTDNTTDTDQLANDNEDNFKMPKMEQWLALRVHGGARSWPKLPSCFNNSKA